MNTKIDEALDKMWNEQKKTQLGTCAICSICGGSSTSWCDCARKRFDEATRGQLSHLIVDDAEEKEAKARLKEKEDEETERVLQDNLRKLREQIRKRC